MVRRSFTDYSNAEEAQVVVSLIEEIRSMEPYIPELELIMTDENDEVIGYAMFSGFHLGGRYKDELLLLSPVAVKTEWQRQHISKQLIEYGFEKAKELGYKEVIVEGNCQRPGILSSRSERIMSVRDKVKCQGGDKEKLTQPEGNVSFRKREQKLPAKTHEALRSLPSVALSSVVGKSLSIKRVHGT